MKVIYSMFTFCQNYPRSNRKKMNEYSAICLRHKRHFTDSDVIKLITRRPSVTFCDFCEKNSPSCNKKKYSWNMNCIKFQDFLKTDFDSFFQTWLQYLLLYQILGVFDITFFKVHRWLINERPLMEIRWNYLSMKVTNKLWSLKKNRE